MHYPRLRRVRAFTITELLVAIAVVMLFLALLLPTLSLSRENARSLVCKSNQRQTALLVLDKVHEDEGRFPTSLDAYRAADRATLVCPSDPSPALVPESVRFESGEPHASQTPSATKKGGGGAAGQKKPRGLAIDLGASISSSYAFNPEYFVHRLRHDRVPDPSDKICLYEGYADAADAPTGDAAEPTQMSIAGQPWFDGQKVMLTHIPPGNPFNAQAIWISPSAVDAHQSGADERHHDLFGDWVSLGSFDAFYTISEDFVRRHRVGRPHGNVVFLDGHVQERETITAGMLTYPLGSLLR